MYQHAAGSWALERDTKNEAYQQARSNELTKSLKKMWQKDTKSTEVVANLSCALEDTNHDLAAFAASICPSPQQSQARTQSTTESKLSATSSAGMVDPGSSSINRFPMHLLVLNRGFQESPMVQWHRMETVSIFAWPMSTKTIWDIRELCIKNDEGRLSTQLLEMGKQGRSATPGPKILYPKMLLILRWQKAFSA